MGMEKMNSLPLFRFFQKGKNCFLHSEFLIIIKTFDGRGNFEEPVHYLDRQYSPYFNPSDIIVDDFGGKSGKEILVSVSNIGRSPFFLARIDKNNKIVGEYWHFGQLDFIYEVRIGLGKKESNHCLRYK